MIGYKKVIFIILGTIIFSFIQQVSAADKIAVEVSASSEDTVGQRLIYQVKEHIQRSSALRLTKSEEPRISLYIVTLDPDQNEPGKRNMSTIYSTNYMVSGTKTANRHLDSSVGIVGSNHVNEVAERIGVKLDKMREEVDFSKGLSDVGDKIQQDRISEIFKMGLEINRLHKQIELLETELAKEKARSGK